MNESLERLISTRFPMINRARYPDTDFGYWGYMIPDGWFPLVVQFAKALEEINPTDLVIYQIKEKMGRLVICSECAGSEEDLAALDDLEVMIEQYSQMRCGRCGDVLDNGHNCHPHWLSHDDLVRWATNYM